MSNHHHRKTAGKRTENRIHFLQQVNSNIWLTFLLSLGSFSSSLCLQVPEQQPQLQQWGRPNSAHQWRWCSRKTPGWTEWWCDTWGGGAQDMGLNMLWTFRILLAEFRAGRWKEVDSPGLNGQLGVENTGRDTKLFQKEFEPVAPVHCSHKHQRLALNQSQPQQRVDQQELVLLLTSDAVLLQLTAVWQLRALKL